MAKETIPKNRTTSSRARLVVNLLIILLALIGLTLLKIHSASFWVYTFVYCVVIAILCAGLSFYPGKNTKSKRSLSFWRQLLYWLGFVAAVYLVSLLLQYGIANASQVGLFALILSAAALFFNGLVYDLAFLLTGITIALMVAGAIVLSAYLLLVTIPIAIIMGFFIFLLIKKTTQQQHETTL